MNWRERGIRWLSIIPKPTWRMAAFILCYKLLLFLLVLFLPSVLSGLPAHETQIASRFTHWDGGYYLRIAEHGYTQKGETLFYPLWPALIRAGSSTMGVSVLVFGMILANLFSLMAMLIFHQLVWWRRDLPSANAATWLLQVFPGAVFFFFPYTESLFLLLVMTCFASLERRVFWGVVTSAFLLPLTRATGIFIFPVLVYEMFSRRERFELRKWISICLAPLLGYFCYFVLMKILAGNAFAGYAAQLNMPSHPSFTQISDFPGFAKAFIDVQSFHDMLHSCLDRAVFVAVLLTLYWVWRIDPSYYIYAALSGVIPALSNEMASYTRYASVVFPCFIVWSSGIGRKWILTLLSLLFFGLQVLLLLRQISNQWAG